MCTQLWGDLIYDIQVWSLQIVTENRNMFCVCDSCVSVCVCVVSDACMWVCVCGVWWMCLIFFWINIYLQHVPLHGNTRCSSVHMIHCLFFWSVFGTTCGNLFQTMTNYHSVWKSIDLIKVANACMYLFVSSSFGGGEDPPLHTTVFIMEPLCASRILHLKIMWSDVCCASLQGHMGSSASWNLCR